MEYFLIICILIALIIISCNIVIKIVINMLRKIIEALACIINPNRNGIGVDLGVKEFATLSNGRAFFNCNSTEEIKNLLKQYNMEITKREYEKAARIMGKIESIRMNYINYVIEQILAYKPKFITIEDLHFKDYTTPLGMAIQNQKFDYFKEKLIKECHKKRIQLRMVPSNFPSSKTCSKCGFINKKLKLSDRTYVCPKCKARIERDFNAAQNLKNAKKYKIL